MNLDQFLKRKFVIASTLATVTSLFISNVVKTQPTVANSNPPPVVPLLLTKNLKNLTIVFPSRKDAPNLQEQVGKVANFLSRELGIPVTAQISDDTAAVEALRANRADVAFLSSRPALKAEKLANSRMHLAETRSNYSGRYTYNSIFVVAKDSPLTPKASAKATMEQLRGKKIAFTSPTSGSGFIFPVSELVKNGFVPDKDRMEGFFGQITYGGNYSKALEAVVRGQADVATVSEYAMYPPYISTTDAAKLRVLYKISGVPAHGIVVDDDVPVVMREKIINAFLKLNKPENNQLLQGLYNSTELVRVNHNRHLKPVRDALKNLGIEP